MIEEKITAFVRISSNPQDAASLSRYLPQLEALKDTLEIYRNAPRYVDLKNKLEQHEGFLVRRGQELLAEKEFAKRKVLRVKEAEKNRKFDVKLVWPE